MKTKGIYLIELPGQEPLVEPVKAAWIDGETGLKCSIGRGYSGALCGYVRVPKGKLKSLIVRHQRLARSKIKGWKPHTPKVVDRMTVHGGITYCERDKNGEVWIGFDCAHYNDYLPGYKKSSLGWANLAPYTHYRDFTYVKKEVEELAAQTRNMVDWMGKVRR